MLDDHLSGLAVDRNQAATRRSLFGRTAKLAGAGALAMVAASPVVAGGSSLAATREFASEDIAILERLVTWELRMGAMFGTALTRFVCDDGSAGDRLLPSQPSLTRIWFHDRSHLALLKERLEGAGGSVQLEVGGDEPFQLETFAAFLWTAAEMKNASVPLYVEAAAALETPALRKVVASILAVEARHAAYLSARIDEPAFTMETEGLVSTSSLLMDGYRFAPSDGKLVP